MLTFLLRRADGRTAKEKDEAAARSPLSRKCVFFRETAKKNEKMSA
jgi:hypothetical protein